MERLRPSRRLLLQAPAAGALLSGLPAVAAIKPQSSAFGGKWQFRQADGSDWLPATVPGTVHTDLLAAGKIADPFWRTNERDQQWIDKKDWEYRTTFTANAGLLGHDHAELTFHGLDTYADVYVNDALVLQADNMFRTWAADIKPHLKPGANALRVYFHSPVNKGLELLDAFGFNPPATNDQSENGGLGDKRISPFTRKAGYHYGWDWGPRFVTSGIWRPITLRGWSGARITDLNIVQDAVSADEARLTAAFEIEASQAGQVVIDLDCADDKTVRARATIDLQPGLNTAELKLTVAKPRLWWTNGLGEAHLYHFTGRLAGEGAQDSREVATGLRTLKIVQQPDAGGTSFYVELNGVPVFMKGANYIPNDSFLTRVTHEVHDKVVGSAVATHMNMLRVWGGGIYEEDYFYDLCDRHGILIWHDFMFACSMYPGDDAFLDNVRKEVEENVRRLRNHACLALWVGNNEIDSAWEADVPNGGWGWKQNYTQAQQDQLTAAYDAIFHKILPDAVAKFDPQRLYRPSSPLASWDGQTVRHADLSTPQQSGDIHYWDVWWGQKPFSDYRTHIGRFMSEYGFQSFPEFRTVQAYAAPGDYDIFSDVMKAHQRSSIGNGTIKNYMQRDYRVPADFQQFLYVGQVLQAEGIKVAMEAHRARMPYCMGSLFWQINDCWPVASWSSIDYFGRWKAQQYFARKAYAPVLVSPVLDGDTVTVTVVNDLMSAQSSNLILRVIDFHGRTITETATPLTVEANSSTVVVTKSVDDLLAGAAPETALLHVYASSGGVDSGNILYFAPVKALNLPPPAIVKKAVASKGGITLALTSASLVKNLYLAVDGHDGSFSDNYFDILPGDTVTVTFRPAKPLSARAFAAGLRMTHMAEIATSPQASS